MNNFDNTTEICNVLVIGAGGAGLRAAIEAKMNGLAVSVIGKRSKFDAHTVLAAGGINASFGNLDIQDSWEVHFADTFKEGYCIGDPEQIEIMAKESPELVLEIDKWGANFDKLDDGKLDQRFFGAHTYRRTCYSGDYTGESILKALIKKADSLNIPIIDNQYVTELLIHEDYCFGAMSFDISSGDRTVHLADSTILCTGGHTRIWKRSSSRKQENTGDGYYLGLNAGCELIDMEMVQFHPTGMIYPDEVAGTLVTEAVRGEGGKLLNINNERFMKNYDKERMELSTRDKIAYANFKEIEAGRCTEKGGIYLDISHKDKEFIINKIPKIYRQFIETQMLDISKEAMEVAPTAHYSMGGIRVNSEKHSTSIQGLFAAGEVVGGLHGANRLGGNSLAEILIFGRKAGRAASIFSKNLNFQRRSNLTIKNAHNFLNEKIKKGNELALVLQNELQEIMWKYCGVVKNEENLNIGLDKLNNLKTLSNNIDVRLSDNNCQDLINCLNFHSSILTAEATILSSIARKESRGSHQRSDFRKIDNKFNCNFSINLINGKLIPKRIKLKKLSSYHTKIVNDFDSVLNFKGRLLE